MRPSVSCGGLPRPFSRAFSLRWLALAFGSTLVACGGGGAGSGSAPSGSPPPVDPPPAPSLTVLVGAVSPVPEGAVRADTLAAVPWSTLPPGAEVIVAAGPQAGPITITAQGTSALPITVRAADPAHPPVVDKSLDFQGAAWVRVSGLTVDGSPWGAAVIRRGSHHITLDGNTLRNSYMGVDISDGAGTGLRIVNNTIEDNQTHGIAIVEVNADATDRSVVSGNTVRRNGHHGMEIEGSNYVVEHNTVSDSGLQLGGTTGIHLYSSTLDGYCDDNLVRYNFSYNNHDRVGYDGNGIQADHWCDRNTISYNVVWGNDGAGIAVFDGADNQVVNNTTHGNGQDPKRRTDQLGEIILSSQGTGVDRTRGNRVFNNLMLPTRPEVAGLLIDYTTADDANTLGPNQVGTRPAGSWVMQRGGRFAATQAELNAVSGITGNLVETPRLADVTAPMAHGLRLTRTPTLAGVPVTGTVDLMGTVPVPTMSFFGAYYTAAGLN